MTRAIHKMVKKKKIGKYVWRNKWLCDTPMIYFKSYRWANVTCKRCLSKRTV